MRLYKKSVKFPLPPNPSKITTAGQMLRISLINYMQLNINQFGTACTQTFLLFLNNNTVDGEKVFTLGGQSTQNVRDLDTIALELGPEF